MQNAGWLGLVLAVSSTALAEPATETNKEGTTAATATATTTEKTETPVVLKAVTIVGEPDDLARTAGSAQVLDADTLRASRVFTTNEALRKLPGVSVRDEEGFGLRPNIGIRGLNPTRSTKVLLLEDGIPLTYGVYGDNASYYHPPIERFDRVEVLKGATVNLYGPQTIGGVINYITPIPSKTLTGGLSLAGGNRDYFAGHGTVSLDGHRFDYVRKQSNGARDNTDLAIDDVNYKGVIAVTGDHTLIARANYYRENSQVSYSGLTDAEYRNFGARYNPFENDYFDAYRWGASLTDDWTIGRARLTTNAYFANFARNWWRQSSTTTDTQCGNAFRDARLAGNAVDSTTCNSVQGRLRDYYNAGIEPRLTLPYTAFGVDHELQTGVRYHFERQDRLQVNGSSPTARSGTIVEDNQRDTDAISGYAQNEVKIGAFTFAPGIRVEHVNYERTDIVTGADGKADLTRVLYSFSSSYAVNERTTLYTGIHKGFAPPRTEDIVDNSGVAVDVNAESSINFEAGVRARPVNGLRIEGTYFRNDFKNQIAVGNIAGGSVPLAQGETLYEGFELSGRADIGSWLPGAHNPFVELAWTALPTADQETALTQVSNGATIAGSAPGRRLPYAARHTLTSTLGYSHNAGFEGRLEAVYIGQQFSDFANTETPATNGNGQVGKISGTTVWNLALNYAVPNTGFGVFFTVKNLFDQVYIVDRTRGIVPGAPRLVQGGVEYRYY
ncbi:MAG: TonB-dependent receptor family protein [Nevskia sp.]|uniref:TonB-dependent receptor family protein n=1 Tax=Nevskia sp. TaxID=1929292 RepID=UPI004036EF94